MKKTKERIAHVEPFLWTWGGQISEDKFYPVKVRITYNKNRKYYPIHFEGKQLKLQKEKWAQIQNYAIALKSIDKKIRLTIIDAIAAAQNAVDKSIEHNRSFTFDRFEKEFLTKDVEDGFLSIFRNHLEELKKENRIGTYKSYNNAYSAFNKFRGGDLETEGRELNPVDITPELLKNFEIFLKGKGVGKTSIAIYMRTLKVIINLVIDANPSLKDHYPFATKQNDRHKYKIKAGSGKKGDVLSTDQLKKFMLVDVTNNYKENEAKNLWLFSLYNQGMNFSDLAKLTYANIKDGILSYVRKKTSETEKNEKKIEITLEPPSLAIIKSIGNPDASNQSYLFLFLEKNMDEERQNSVIKQKIKMVNKYLKTICLREDLPPITTYWARHTYANLILESGESTESLRELLDHSDLRTTESYVKRRDLNHKSKMNKKAFSLLE